MRQASQALSVSLLALLCACSSGGDDNGNAPPTTTSVSGTVLNSPTPVGGVEVTLRGPGGTFETVTSSSGTYIIDGVPTGEYTIQFDGQGVFDSNGDPIADKIDLRLPATTIGAGGPQAPAFLPERGFGLTVDTSGTREGTVAAGTLIENGDVRIYFAEETVVTFPSSDDTNLAIIPVPTGEIPVALPSGLSASALVAIEPAGTTFDIRPEISFANGGMFPSGVSGIRIFRLGHSSGRWAASGTGEVSADGGRILSSAGEGIRATGWHAIVVDTFCETDIVGQVTTSGG
ncbi:MAG: carboxypeptidase regulatory-like domain-containing protein, partial [Planctomycetota bacterium]